MIKLSLPIYWEQEFKTKPNKFHLVGLNQLFHMHYQVRNKLKQDFHKLVIAQIANQSITGPFTVEYNLYYKNINSDPGNIIAGIEKVLLDGLQECNAIEQDNPKYHKGTSWQVIEQDKTNPRIEILIKPIK